MGPRAELCDERRRDPGAMPSLEWRAGHTGRPQQGPARVRVAKPKVQALFRSPESTKEVLRTLDATKGLFPRSLDAPHGESEGAAAQAPRERCA